MAERKLECGFSNFVVAKEGELKKSITLLIGNVHCASCIQRIESRLAREQSVVSARLNFTTKQLRIVFEGQHSLADQYVQDIEEVGYPVSPCLGLDDAVNAEKKEEKFLLLCLAVAGFAMGNIMLLSVGLWVGSADEMGINTRDFMHYISGLIAIPCVTFSGRPFFKSAFRALRAGAANMDVPISLAILLATGMSVYETLTHGAHVYFDSAVMLMFFLLIGRYLDSRIRGSVRSDADNLLSLLATFATQVTDNGEHIKILLKDIREGMVLLVPAGDRICADGKITEGSSAIDMSLVTGESLPQNVQCGEKIYAGTLNLNAPITMVVEQVSAQSLLGDIVRLMDNASQSKARYVRLADRAARLYTPVVHSLAALTFLGWICFSSVAWQDALMVAVTVLIITCPCALGLAVPVVQVLAVGRMMKNKVLVKSGDALERLARVDTILFDKTGTLTKGCLTLVEPLNNKQKEVISYAAYLSKGSRHPLSVALSQYCSKDAVSYENIQESAGEGLSGIDKETGQICLLGSASYCQVQGCAKNESSSSLEVWFKKGNDEPVVFQFSDALKEDAKDVIASLKQSGYRLEIISGDRVQSVERTARDLELEFYQAEMKPKDKFDYIETLKSDGKNVLMVGDGLNDTPVLAAANVAASPASAIDMAQNVADIIFMGDKLAPLESVIKTAKRSTRIVKQNFGLAVVYNILAIPLAVFGFVSPMIAAIAMSGSSLVVILNSLRVRKG